MAVQPSVRPDEASALFPDGRGNRPVVPGTVARGYLRTDWHLFTGKRPRQATETTDATMLAGISSSVLNSVALLAGEQYSYSDEASYVDSFPFPVTRAVLEHGRDRYTIFCAVCHDSLGTGHGKIVERGYTQPPSYHIERLRQAPVGHIFNVITHGYGSMPQYREQIPPRDRWAIAAYLRALQWSQHFFVSELPDAMRAEWQKAVNGKAAGKEAP